MFKEDDSYTKQQYLDEFGLEQILDDYNAEILKHDCNPICEKKIELIEKRNKVFRLLRDELKELANMVDSETHKHDVIRLVRGINKEIDNEKQWHV